MFLTHKECEIISHDEPSFDELAEIESGEFFFDILEEEWWTGEDFSNREEFEFNEGEDFILEPNKFKYSWE